MARKNYLLGVLLLLLAFNSAESQALGLVLQSIKLDLHLSDTQLGVMTGIAFALFYSVMGIPLARWGDSGNRVTLIAVTTALWGAAVVLCGITRTFVQLMMIRVAVAIGEAGCVPPAHSLIADYFTRAERPRAVSIYMLGAYLSVFIGYFLAGWISQLFGWRVMFVVLGVPGLLLAVLAKWTLTEPRVAKQEIQPTADVAATHHEAARPQDSQLPTLGSVRAVLWSSRTYRHLLYSFVVIQLFGGGIAQWQPAFFIRSYGLTTGEIGTWFAVIYGGSGLIGAYLGGLWAFRRAANNERLQLKAIALAYSGLGLVSLLIYLSPNQYLAFGLMGLAGAGPALASGPLFATIQTLVPERMRALSIAVIYLFANLIGMGLGPLVVGALSDALNTLAGQESLRYALMALSPGYWWGGWHLWQASKTVFRDLEAAQLHHKEGVPDGDRCAIPVAHATSG